MLDKESIVWYNIYSNKEVVILKKKKQHEIKERKFWDVSPIEKVVPNKKRYNRKKDKKEKEYRYR